MLLKSRGKDEGYDIDEELTRKAVPKREIEIFGFGLKINQYLA